MPLFICMSIYEFAFLSIIFYVLAMSKGLLMLDLYFFIYWLTMKINGPMVIPPANFVCVCVCVRVGGGSGGGSVYCFHVHPSMCPSMTLVFMPPNSKKLGGILLLGCSSVHPSALPSIRPSICHTF